jgi:DNA repair photolyase
MAAIYEPKGMAREYAPLACNLYKGCLHGCKYCYAPACLRMQPEQFWSTSNLRADVLSSLEREARKHAASRLPVLFCFTSDPYQPNETGDTRTALQMMIRAGCQFQVLTKGGTRAVRDLDCFQAKTLRGEEHRGPCAFGTTLLFTNDADRAEWEPNAAPVEDRIEAIKTFHAAGIRTWVSIEPVIDPTQAVNIVETLSPWVDEWRVGKLNHHKHAKTVDWHDFAANVIRALEDSGRDFMVKDALQPFLPQGAPVRRYATEQISEHARETERQLSLLA